MKNELNEWILTDDGMVPQWVKKMNISTFMVVEVVPIFESFFIKENVINVNDYKVNEIIDELKPFGYNSLSEVEKIYGESKYQIISECIAENRTPSTSDTDYECSNPNSLKEKLKLEYNIIWSIGDDWFEQFIE